MTRNLSKARFVASATSLILSSISVSFGIAVLATLTALPDTAAAQCKPALGCSGCTTRGEKLKCKFDTMMEEGKKTIDHLQAPPYSDLLPPAQMEGLTKSKENLDRGKSRLGPNDFQLLVKKKDASCQTVEIDGDGIGNDDGVCNKNNERCAEVIGDGIGNDDGVCWPLHGKNREVCVQICDEEATLQDEANVDDALSADLEGVYDNLIDHSKEVNENLPEVAAMIFSTQTVTNGTDPCPIDAQGLKRTLPALKALARGAATGARGGADIGERLCDQQVAGFNCAACCAPAEAIAGALEAAWTAIELVEATINSATIDAALGCVAAMKQAASDNNAWLTQIQADMNQAKADQAEIIRLLRSPLGQREEVVP